MNRWTRANLLLAVLGIGLVGLIYWPDRRDAGPRLTALDPASISSVRIERDDRLALALQRSAAGWQISHPIEARANPSRVARLLTVAAAPVQQQVAASDGDPARYGTGDAAIVVQFDDRRATFGDRDPTQRSRYVQIDDRILLIDDLFYSLLTLPAGHYSEP